MWVEGQHRSFNAHDIGKLGLRITTAGALLSQVRKPAFRVRCDECGVGFPSINEWTKKQKPQTRCIKLNSRTTLNHGWMELALKGASWFML